jgi:hypothetical protein
MPRFKSREEYEKWKTDRMGTSEEKPLESPQKSPGPLERPFEFQEALAVPEKKIRSPHEKSPKFEEKPLEARKISSEPLEMFLEPQEVFQKSTEKPWSLEENFLDFRERKNEGLELDTGEEPDESSLSHSGGRPPRRRANLRSIGDLLSDSWNIFKTRFPVLMGLYLLPFFLMLGVMGIFIVVSLLSRSFLSLDIKAAIAGGVLIGMIPAMVIMSWGMAGFTYAVVDETVGFTEALSKGWSRLWAFTWVWSLVGFIVTGTLFLLIVPGILLGIWFFFAPFVLAGEDEKGMNALLKSKEYVRGQWFPVFGRMAAVSSISFGIGLIPVVGSLIGVIFAPFFLVYTKLVYDDLRAMKGGSVVYSHSRGEKFKWVGLGTVGYVVLPVIMVALMGASLTLPLLMLKGMVNGQGPFNFCPPKESRPFKPTPVTLPGQDRGVGQESDQVDPQRQAGIASTPRANPAEATGEAAVVRNGVKETFVLKTGFFSSTRLKDPEKASIQFEIEGAKEHSNARRIEIALDATKAGEHRVDGKVMQEAFFTKFKNNPGDQPPVEDNLVKFQFIADGGQIFFPKDSCTILITSPYTGTSDGVFAGEVYNCVVASAGIDHTVSAKFKMTGVPSR